MHRCDPLSFLTHVSMHRSMHILSVALSPSELRGGCQRERSRFSPGVRHSLKEFGIAQARHAWLQVKQVQNSSEGLSKTSQSAATELSASAQSTVQLPQGSAPRQTTPGGTSHHAVCLRRILYLAFAFRSCFSAVTAASNQH